jgi:hypothetical protein
MASFFGVIVFSEYTVFIDIIENTDCQEKNLFGLDGSECLDRLNRLDGLFRLQGLLGLLGLAGFDRLDGLDRFIGFFEFSHFRDPLECSLVPEHNPFKNWNDGVME